MGSSVPAQERGSKHCISWRIYQFCQKSPYQSANFFLAFTAITHFSYVPTRPNALDRQLKPVTLLVMTLQFLMEREP